MQTIPATLRLRARQAATSSRHATFVYICFAYSLDARRCPILVFVEMLDVHYRVLAFLGSKRFFGNLSPLTIRKPATPIYYIPHGTVPAPLPFAALELACWACSQRLRLQLCFSHWLRWERSWVGCINCKDLLTKFPSGSARSWWSNCASFLCSSPLHRCLVMGEASALLPPCKLACQRTCNTQSQN